ncbi:hypothetical protein [Actinopolyspora halophila]|uniref:hypothetical protein n=1 Tax=Actinopolyspora halophila TaxID=1850 RepID=UPI00037F35E1|nr:hypothetical protein [Actinopolyspora halophila]
MTASIASPNDIDVLAARLRMLEPHQRARRAQAASPVFDRLVEQWGRDEAEAFWNRALSRLDRDEQPTYSRPGMDVDELVGMTETVLGELRDELRDHPDLEETSVFTGPLLPPVPVFTHAAHLRDLALSAARHAHRPNRSAELDPVWRGAAELLMTASVLHHGAGATTESLQRAVTAIVRQLRLVTYRLATTAMARSVARDVDWEPARFELWMARRSAAIDD